MLGAAHYREICSKKKRPEYVVEPFPRGVCCDCCAVENRSYAEIEQQAAWMLVDGVFHASYYVA